MLLSKSPIPWLPASMSLLSPSSITCLLLFPSISSMPVPTSLEEMNPGNLALCTTIDNIDAVGGDLHCLGWNGSRTFEDIDEKASRNPGLDFLPADLDDKDEPLPNWRYENGLLRAPFQGSEDGVGGSRDLCLGPSDVALFEAPCKPYELKLQECPSESNVRNSIVLDEGYDNAVPTDAAASSEEMAASRHMRFLVTGQGRVQSLAPVLERRTGRDVIEMKPFCLTMLNGNDDGLGKKPYLVPCQPENKDGKDTNHDDRHGLASPVQVFGVYGTYSDSFVMVLQTVWGYNEVVKLAYQVGIPTGSMSSFTSSATIVIEQQVGSSNSHVDNSTPMLVKEIPLVEDHHVANSISGILSFSSCQYEMVGPMTATLHSIRDDVNASNFEASTASTAASRAFFVVSDPRKESLNGFFEMFVIIFCSIAGCFTLSMVADWCLKDKIRAFGTLWGENSDGKTVCLDDDLDDNFDLEKDEGTEITSEPEKENERTADEDNNTEPASADDSSRNIDGSDDYSMCSNENHGKADNEETPPLFLNDV